MPGYLLKYDSQTLELLGVTRLDRNPGDVRLTPDGSKVVVTHFDLAKIQAVDDAGGSIDEMIAPLAIVEAATMKLLKLVPTCPAGHGVWPAADSSKAFVACYGSDELAVVGLAAPYPVTKFHVGSAPINPPHPTYGPYAVVQSPSDGTLWVADILSNDLRVFDPATSTWDVRGPDGLGGSPYFGRFSADGARFYVPVQQQNALVVVDATSHDVIATLDFAQDECEAPHAVILLEDQGRALVVCEGDRVLPGTVAVVDITTPSLPTLDKVLTVGVYPDDAFLLAGAP